MTPAQHKLTLDEVVALAQRHGHQLHCPQCASFKAPGWSSWPQSSDESHLECLGALWLPGDDEPSLEEVRSFGMDLWSPDMPISLRHHPANRSQVWVCRACHKPFLRYTEHGGYYIDHRLRELKPSLLVA